MNSRSPWLLCSCSLRRIKHADTLISNKGRHVPRIRKYATAMQTQKSAEPTQSTTSPIQATPEPKDPNYKQKFRAMKIPKPKEWHVLAGVLLSRPPLLLPELHPFEERVQQYQEMIEKHQYTRFPINFFFKQGSIGEKRWKQLHRKEAKVSGSGIIREVEDEEAPEYILGGTSDEQVMKSRMNAPPPQFNEKAEEEEEELSDEEKRDLEQFAAEEEEFEDSETDLPDEVNLDLHRLERVPRETLYCLVKRSREYHKKSGKSVRGWGLIETEAPGVDSNNKVEGLHVAASRAIERHLGPRVQTWVVGTNPAAYLTYPHKKPLIIGRQRFFNTREFIMKAHIFAGAVRLRKKYCTDFVWVTRDEMEQMIDARTFKAILPLLADR